jgi:uncharacterized protein YndB with AHSA1/START domain
MDLKFQVQTKIQKPVKEVFEAVYNPKELSRYFTTAGASAPLKEGTTVNWEFADVPDLPGPFPVQVKKVVQNKLIALEWKAQDGNYDTRVEMTFESLSPESTLVKISESGWKENQKGLDSSYDNCQGWMQMSCSLKAYLEYGINLRKGFF